MTSKVGGSNGASRAAEIARQRQQEAAQKAAQQKRAEAQKQQAQQKAQQQAKKSSFVDASNQAKTQSTIGNVGSENKQASLQRSLTKPTSTPGFRSASQSLTQQTGSLNAQPRSIQRGNPLSDLVQGAGQAIGNAGNTLGNAVQGAGQAIGNAGGVINDAAQTIGNAAQTIGQGIGNAANTAADAANTAQDLVQGATNAAAQVGGAIGNAADTLGDAVQGAGQTIGNTGGAISDAAQTIGNAAQNIGQGLGQGIGDAANAATDAANDAAQGLGNAAQDLVQGATNAAAQVGGQIESKPDATQTGELEPKPADITDLNTKPGAQLEPKPADITDLNTKPDTTQTGELTPREPSLGDKVREGLQNQSEVKGDSAIGRGLDQATDAVKDAAGNAVETVKDAAGNVADAVQDAAGNVADAVKDVAGNVVDAVRGEGQTQTGETGEADEPGGFLNNVVDNVRDAAENVVEGVKNAATQAQEAALEAATPAEPNAQAEAANPNDPNAPVDAAGATDPNAPAEATDPNDPLQAVRDQIGELDLGDEQANAVLESATNAVNSDDPGERLEAGLDTLNQLREILPEDQLDQLPGIAQNLSNGLPAATEFVGLANTLTDPEASSVDKAQAALDFANEAGNLLEDDQTRERLTNTLDRFGAGLDAVNLVNTVTDPDASNLDKAKATIDFANTVGDLLPEGKQQRLFNSLGTLGAPIATVENAMTLLDGDASIQDRAEAFVGLVGGLGDTVDSVRDIGRALDDLGVSRTLGLGPGSTARGLFDDAAGALEDVASRLGARVGPELLQSAGKALGKVIPALGAAVSGFDTVRMGQIAADSSLPGEIRYIAGLGAGINGVDTVLGITEAFGVGNIGLPANIALGVGGFAADIATQQMIQQHENGDFNPSDELRALIGVSAVATGPAGLANLTNAFGLDGSIGVLRDTVQVGGEYAGRAAEALFEFAKDKGEEAIREVGEFVADLPGDVRDSISGALNGAADLFGDAAGAFVDGLGGAADTVLDGINGFGDFLGGIADNIFDGDLNPFG